MLTKFTEIIERYLAGPMATIANQRHLRAIRDGIIATLPLIIVGSFFLIIAFPPYHPVGGSISSCPKMRQLFYYPIA